MLFEIGEMEPGTTGNIQKTVPCGTTILVHEGGELFCFSTIIFHGEVDGVVILGCVGKHRSPLLPPCIGYQLASHCKPITGPISTRTGHPLVCTAELVMSIHLEGVGATRWREVANQNVSPSPWKSPSTPLSRSPMPFAERIWMRNMPN